MTQTEEKTLLYRILVFVATTVITVSMAVSGYFIRENINSINKCKDDIVAIQLNAEKVSSSRFTAMDFIKAREIIDSQQLSMDKRLTILEENMKAIKELMFEIKTDLKIIKEKHYTAALTEN